MAEIIELNASTEADNADVMADASEKLDNAIEKVGGKKKLVELLGQRTVELVEPFTWAGNTYTALELNFRGLTGLDMMAISDEMKALRLDTTNPAENVRYQVRLAARAAHVSSDVIENLPACDFNSVVAGARYFLLATAS